VHYGHTGLARWVVEHTDLDEVWLMVSPNNPLKDRSILADEQERLEGVKRAIEGIPGLRACDLEFALPRPSYTANTLRELEKRYPQHRFSLIIGEDNLAIFTRWREWEYLLEHYPILVYPRRGSEPIPAELSGKVHYMSGAPYYDVSSTQIRKKAEKSE